MDFSLGRNNLLNFKWVVTSHFLDGLMSLPLVQGILKMPAMYKTLWIMRYSLAQLISLQQVVQ